MKILKILLGNDGGGIFTCESQFISYWVSKGVTVDVIIVGTGKAVETYKQLASDFQLVENLDAHYAGNVVDILRSIRKSNKFASHIISEVKFNGYYNAVIYRRPVFIHIAGRLGKLMKTKVYWHLPSFINRKLGRIYYNFFMDRYGIEPIANSTYTQKTVGKRCKQVIYPGFDEQRVRPSVDNFRQELGIPFSAKVFGIAARINHSKAQDLVIKAMVDSGAFEQNMHLIIAGELIDVAYVNKCKELAGAYLSQVHFLGRISDLSKFYSSIDVYVNSRRNEEPFGISIAEALGAGLPVMAYYLGGPSEMIVEEKNGWLIKEATESGYTSAFEKCLSQKDQWKQMGEWSLSSSEKFSAKLNAENFLEILAKNTSGS